MEDTSKIPKKVANPAATRKAELVTVEYTKKSVHYPGRATVSRTLAETLEKSGKAVIIKI